MKTIYRKSKAMLFVLLLTFLSVFSAAVYGQDPPQYGTPFAGVPHPMDANIYQLNVREFSSTRNFAGAQAKLQHLKDLGINVIYLMPIYPTGSLNASGSPYAIRDFKNVAPDLGTLASLRSFVDAAHSRGMAVILDWVANQTSWDHPWITANKSWYVQDANGNIKSPCPSPDFCFNDVAALNFNNSAMRAAMVDAMRYWIFAANIDGFRQDFADHAPQDFWANTNNNLRSITSHKLLLLAEGSNEGTTSGCNSCGNNQPGAHYAQGFDYIFGTDFYWSVMRFINLNGAPSSNLDMVTTREYRGASSTQMVTRYLSNHDDYTAHGSPFSYLNGGRNAVMSMFVVAAYHRGVPFIYNGLEVGNTNPLPYPWNSGNINWSQDLSVYTEMQKILNFRNSSMAIKRGQPTTYNSNPDVIAFTKSNGTEKVSVMVNVRNGARNFVIPAGMGGTYRDAYSGATVTLTSGATRSLSAFQYLVLTSANVSTGAVTGVSITPTSASISVNGTRQLTATITPTNATNQNVTWTSSNTAVATVSATGLVTGRAAGTATITVTTQDGNRTSTSAITVTAGSSFTVNFFRPSNWGTGIRIYWWAAQPAGSLADGTWPGVAMSNLGDGWYSYTFTNVTSTNLIFNDGTNQSADLNRNKTGWYMNGVWYDTKPGTTIAVTGVTLSSTLATVNVNATTQLTATVAPSNATNKNVSWSSSNTAVATVSTTGLVTGRAAGSATITVTTQDGSRRATCSISVPNSTATRYYIINRWQNTYLYDNNQVVKYGTTPSGTAYQWVVEDFDGHKRIKNVGTGRYMNIENLLGYVQCTAITSGGWSGHWILESYAGYTRIRNRWQSGNYVHVENLNGNAQSGTVDVSYWSGHWTLRSVTTARLSESNSSREALEVFPNPVNQKFVNIVVPGTSKSVNVRVLDAQGNLLKEHKSTQSAFTMDMHSLKQGIYMLVIDGDKQKYTRKIVIE